jgi:hypothetical protein
VTPWLFLIHRIPPRPLYLRAKMLQRLSGVGAVSVKNAVYVLPRGDETLEDFQWIAQEIVAAGGDAHLIEGGFVDAAAHEAAVAQFRAAREADYRALAADGRTVLKGPGKTPEALAAAHERLSRRLQQIRRLDFFEAPGRQEAEQAVGAIESRAARGRKQEAKSVSTQAALRGRTWVTRPGVKVDRIASAWFIRRFVDAKARFRFEDPRAARKKNDIRFDMTGGDFTHEGDRCTIETLIARVGLPDSGVRAIAEIVHDIDLKESRFGRPETAGVAAMIDGLVRRYADDAERIEHGFAIFDGLHESLGRTRRKTK